MQRRSNMSQDLGADSDSDVSSVSSYGDAENGTGSGNANEPKYRDPDSRDGAIEVPDYLEGAAEEITAFAKESRYTDATELWCKTKEDANDIVRQVRDQTSNHPVYIPFCVSYRLSSYSMNNQLIIS